MEVRAELKYTKSHEWVKEEGGVWTIGLTDYAQSALGDLVFVNLPEAGDSVEAGEVFGDVESCLLYTSNCGINREDESTQKSDGY